MESVRNAARYLGVGWDLVKDIFKADLGKRLKRRKIGQIRYIAVDEFATHKGHTYMTVVLDLETGEIQWTGKRNNVRLPPALFRKASPGWKWLPWSRWFGSP
jgi:hypothetical protein